MGIRCVIRRIKGKINKERDIPLHLYAVVLESETLVIKKCKCCNKVEVEIKGDIENE